MIRQVIYGNSKFTGFNNISVGKIVIIEGHKFIATQESYSGYWSLSGPID